MNRTLLLMAFALALSLFSSVPVSAQSFKPSFGVTPSTKISKELPDGNVSAAKAAPAQQPRKHQTMHVGAKTPQTDFPMITTGVIAAPTVATKALPRRADASTTIWGYLCSKGDQNGTFGYNTFHPTSNITFTPLFDDHDNIYPYLGENGIQYKNGWLYGVYANSNNNIFNVYGVDLNNLGNSSTDNYSFSSDYKFIATATAQAMDGTVYGEFWTSASTSSDGGYEWGTVDYSTMTRTTIGPATHRYVALGITNDDKLYGIAEDGNLYSIDTRTGKETLVGSTGLDSQGLYVLDDYGNIFAQSGVIDHKDNTFYWAATLSDDYQTYDGLYEVNLSTGAATLISSGCGEIVGMFIQDPEPAANAPAKVSNVSLSFPNGSLSGTVSFTLPTKTYNGMTLKDSVSYTVKRNGEVKFTGTNVVGADIEIPDTVPEAGTYKYSITASNSKGESQVTNISDWIGYDRPNGPTNFTATNNNGKVTLTWNAPKGSANGGYTGALTYDIWRIANRDTVQIANRISALTTEDDLTNVSRAYYKYTIRACAGPQGEYRSNRVFVRKGVVAGEYVEPTWNEYFDDADEFNGVFTLLDANKDGKKWVTKLVSNNRFAASPANSTPSKANDDWLFTPPIHLKPGRVYTVSFKTWNYNTSSNNTVEVLWGDSATATAMKDTVSATITPPQRITNAITVSNDINPTKEGYYYIGFHENTPAGVKKNYLAIDDIRVVAGAQLSQPDSVTNFTLTPAEKGGHSATLSFNVPEKNIDGSDLASVDSINILRDDSIIVTLPSAKGGTAITYTDDKVLVNGFHSYSVVPYTGSEPGRPATRRAYIGIDIPSSTKNFHISDNGDNIIGSWDRFSTIGDNGGYVDPDKVTFTYYKFSLPNYSITDTLVTSQPGDTSVVININPEETTEEDGKTQTFLQLMGRSHNEAGWGRYAMLTNELIIGPSIQLPFRETFKKGGNDNGFSWINGNQQVTSNPYASRWRIGYGTTHDGDGYGVIWSPYSNSAGYNLTVSKGDECSFNLPKVALGGVAHPVLYFDIYVIPNDSALLNIQVQTPDRTIHPVGTYNLANFKTYGWQRCKIDLTPFTNERNVIVRFDGVATGASPTIGLDDINIFNQLDHNLVVKSFSAPEKVDAGKNYKASVVLKNYGASEATDYSVVLYKGEKAVDTVAVSKSLAVLATDTVTLNLPVAPNQESPLNVSAKILYLDDADLSDNTTDTISISVIPSKYLKVNDLGAQASDAGVELSWTRPAPAQETVTEDFESYEPFAKEMGNWTLVDGDKYLSAGVLPGHMYPGQNTAFSFMAFNPNKLADFNVVDANPGIAPHSGDQYAAAIFAVNPRSSSLDMEVDNSNWIISPEIPKSGQTIKFYAFNAAVSATDVYKETFDVLYSTESTDTASFVKIESDVADGKNLMNVAPNWKEFNVTIPAGASYFAIHHTSKAHSAFIFGLDDITFDRIIPGSTDSVVAYNIYRDGVLIATVSGTDVAYSDAKVMPGSHVYNVTVVYKNKKGEINESGFSNDASVISTGIDAIAADANGVYNVYTLDGKAVRLNAKSLKGLKRGAYIINDKKYIVNF